MAKYSRPLRLPSNEDRIYKMRMYENKPADNMKAVKTYDQLMRSAEFSEQNIKKREEREIESREEAIRQCREQNLEMRRAKLSALLEGEDQLLNDELKTNAMTLSERRSWLEARSRALKQKQNAEACQKDQYVQEMMDKAWRDNSDDVRIQDSKMAVLRAVEGRKRQLEEAVARKIIEEQDADKKFETECMALTAAREAHEILQEKELKEAQRREAKQYAAHLQALASRLRADDSFRNAQFKAEEDAEWAKQRLGGSARRTSVSVCGNVCMRKGRTNSERKVRNLLQDPTILTLAHSVGSSLVPQLNCRFNYLRPQTTPSREYASKDAEWMRVLHNFMPHILQSLGSDYRLEHHYTCVNSYANFLKQSLSFTST